MEYMPFYLVFLHSIPEALILIYLGLLLIGVKPSLVQILWVALFVSLASYIIRDLPLPPGINVFIQLPILIILLSCICSLPIIYATISSFLGFVLIGITETIYNLFMPVLTGITIPQAFAHPLWRALYPLPLFIILGLVIMVLMKYDVVIYNIREAYEVEKRTSSEEEQFK